jgi:cadmium resistance protein CadD (predicted permease)
MGGVAGTIAGAAAMFAGTNIDDLIVLTVLFLASRAGGVPRPWQIWAGQYAGTVAMVLVSMAAALGLTAVPQDWSGLLGLLPLALGVYGLVQAVRARSRGEERPQAAATGLLSVAGVTVAGGVDNISVYTPVFRTIGVGPTAVTITVFVVGVALWCLAGSWLGSHRRVVDLVEHYGQWLVPVVFLVLGVFVVADSGLVAKLL